MIDQLRDSSQQCLDSHAPPPPRTSRSRGSQTTTCMVNRGLQKPLACGHPAVSACLTSAAAGVAVADHSSIAGDLPQRPASDEERLFDLHQRGRAPLDAAQGPLTDSRGGERASIRRWDDDLSLL